MRNFLSRLSHFQSWSPLQKEGLRRCLWGEGEETGRDSLLPWGMCVQSAAGTSSCSLLQRCGEQDQPQGPRGGLDCEDQDFGPRVSHTRVSSVWTSCSLEGTKLTGKTGPGIMKWQKGVSGPRTLAWSQAKGRLRMTGAKLPASLVG